MGLKDWLIDRLGYEQLGSRARGYRAGYSDAMQSAALIARTSVPPNEQLAKEFDDKRGLMQR